MCYNPINATTVYRGVEILLPSFLASALDGGRFTSGVRTSDTHLIGVRVGPRALLDVSEESLLSVSGTEPRFLGCPARSLVTISTTLS
jgi:hypothetical protein